MNKNISWIIAVVDRAIQLGVGAGSASKRRSRAKSLAAANGPYAGRLIQPQRQERHQHFGLA